jgi:hypothetical protein
MLAYCHAANITPVPPRSQNTIPSFGTFRMNPSASSDWIVAAYYPAQSRLERGKEAAVW